MKYPFATREGDKIAIIRPDDPKLAMHLAREAMQIENEVERKRAFDAIPAMQAYTFVGLMATVGKPQRKLLDEKGWSIGECRAGDSLVPYSRIVEMREKAAAELAASTSVIQPESVRLGDGPQTMKMQVGPDGELGPVVDKLEIEVSSVDGENAGEKSTMTVGAWHAPCVCGGKVTATYDGDQPSGMVHQSPPCDDFVRMDPLEFVIWLNEKQKAGTN